MKVKGYWIQTKRVYEPATEADGRRFLVDRLWPRGIKKESVRLAGWLKDIAPSDQLRKWFQHDPAKWDAFQKRYRAELDARSKAWEPLLKAAQNGSITLLFGARDIEHNNAVVLKGYLQERFKTDRRR